MHRDALGVGDGGGAEVVCPGPSRTVSRLWVVTCRGVETGGDQGPYDALLREDHRRTRTSGVTGWTLR